MLTLFRNKRFMLDEMTQRNASKFVIFYIYQNPMLLFQFFISCNFVFPPMNARAFIREKIKQPKMKNGKSNFGFSYI